jgi:poly(3-hydroxybutyrate) depolymerase
MTSSRRSFARTTAGFIVGALASAAACAATLDHAAPPGGGYDKAEFRLWLPDAAGPVKGVVVLVPGSNGDGRPMVDDPFWQQYATRLGLGLVGCRFTDKPHDQMFIEHYVDVSKGTGPALIDALATFAQQANHAELASAPLLLWGMSAGGEFNYEFVAWKPERVIAFIVNKGNVYYTALASQAARHVPGILFTGEKDLEFRINAVAGLFAINRRAGALWAYAQEPGLGHEVGRSRDFAAIFFEEMMTLRLPGMRPLSEKAGYIGDLKTLTFQPVADKAPSVPTAWLPNERVARAWQAVASGRPIDPQ